MLYLRRIIPLTLNQVLSFSSQSYPSSNLYIKPISSYLNPINYPVFTFFVLHPSTLKMMVPKSREIFILYLYTFSSWITIWAPSGSVRIHSQIYPNRNIDPRSLVDFIRSFLLRLVRSRRKGDFKMDLRLVFGNNMIRMEMRFTISSAMKE